MKYQYFIASRWRNRDSVLELTQKLREKGKTVYCFLENKHNFAGLVRDPEEVMQEYEAIPDWRNDKMVQELFEIDMDALCNSESLVLLLPAGKSAHIEAGTAYGMGKKCILVGEQKEAESLYLIFDEIHPAIDVFIQSL